MKKDEDLRIGLVLLGTTARLDVPCSINKKQARAILEYITSLLEHENEVDQGE